MAYIAHGIIKCTPFLSVGHRDNTLFYGTISCLLIFLLNAVRLRLRLVLLYFAMFQCFCAFLNYYFHEKFPNLPVSLAVELHDKNTSFASSD